MAFILPNIVVVAQTFVADFDIIMTGLGLTFEALYRIYYCSSNGYCSSDSNEFE